MPADYQKSPGRRIAFLSILVTLALILSYVEALIPMPFPFPGIKLGLANLVTTAGLYLLSPIDVLCVSLLRILLNALLFGNAAGLMFSLAGGILSFFVMLLVKKTDIFSVYGVSMAGGYAHNIGQIIAASLTVQTLGLLYYLPFLLISGVLTGFLIGLIASRVLPTITRISS